MMVVGVSVSDEGGGNLMRIIDVWVGPLWFNLGFMTVFHFPYIFALLFWFLLEDLEDARIILKGKFYCVRHDR